MRREKLRLVVEGVQDLILSDAATPLEARLPRLLRGLTGQYTTACGWQHCFNEMLVASDWQRHWPGEEISLRRRRHRGHTLWQ